MNTHRTHLNKHAQVAFMGSRIVHVHRTGKKRKQEAKPHEKKLLTKNDKKLFFVRTHREESEARRGLARYVIEKKDKRTSIIFANCLWAITHTLIIAWGFGEWRITLDYNNRVVTLVFVMFYTQNKDIRSVCACVCSHRKDFPKTTENNRIIAVNRFTSRIL